MRGLLNSSNGSSGMFQPGYLPNTVIAAVSSSLWCFTINTSPKAAEYLLVSSIEKMNLLN
jgi:hypothetical protein